MRTWAPIGLGCLALLLGACGGGSSGLPTSLAHLYVYNAKAPLDEVDHGSANHNFPVRIRDVSFSDSKGGGADAYVCVPPGKGPFAGAVFVPGSGSGRADMLFQAVQVAARGAVTLAILTPFIHGVPELPDGLPGARAYRDRFEEETATKAERILSPVDPKRYLRVAKAHLFLQMARFDQLLPANEQEDVIEAAGSGAKVKWYPTGHQMNVQAFTDTVQWVGDELHLGPLPKYARSHG